MVPSFGRITASFHDQRSICLSTVLAGCGQLQQFSRFMYNKMEWSNEQVLKFLELYQREGVIWDPRQPHFKHKLKVQEAWARIEAEMGIPITELKLKKNSLMATFRSHCRRKQASIKSGVTAEDVYQPVWFAYQIMEDFLGPIYDIENSPHTLDSDRLSLYTIENKTEKTIKEETFHEFQTPSPKIIKRKRSSTKEKLMGVVEQLAQTPGRGPVDNWEAFGISVSGDLRELPNPQQTIAQKLISDVIYLAKLGRLTEDSAVINPIHICTPPP